MSEEKKIIIDEDWKTQIAAERAEEEQEAATSKGEPGDSDPNAAKGQVDLPPPSFEMLLTTLATEAMMSLGQMPIPGQQQPEVNLPQAQYVIELISVLKEKTVGNLSDEEKTTLDDLLYQLRMMYVAIEGK